MKGCRLTALTSLNISDCEEVTSDEGLQALSRLTALTSLDISDCTQVTDEGVQALGSLTALMSLKLANCYKVTDEEGLSLPLIPSDHVEPPGQEA